MSEKTKKKFNKTQLKKLHNQADKIQPHDDKVRERDLEGATKNDGKFYDKMKKSYIKMCEQDASFIFHFILPESNKPICFFRHCEPSDYERYKRVGSNLCWSSWRYLCWVGYIKALESDEFIKILPKGEHKTWQEIEGVKI